MKNKVLEASILAIGIIILGLILRSSLLDMTSVKRTVTVKGFSERLVPADKVTWPLAYTLQGNDLVYLYDNVQKVNSYIIGFLKENGVTDSEINVAPPSADDNEANSYSDNKPLYKYDMTSVITVTSSNVDTIRSLILRQPELFKAGIFLHQNDYLYSIEYEFTKLNEIKPQMIQEATIDARNAAEKFAQDSNSKLGKIKYARQGQFSIENRDYNTPHIKLVRVVTTIDYNLKD